jgi:hypothetical protein
MEAHHEMNRRNTVVKRAIVVAISVILALVVAAPIASGQSSSQGKNLGKGQNLGKLTGDWYNWAVSRNPSPVFGPDLAHPVYSEAQCDGNFVDGVFFLAGSLTSDPVTRTCTVPANTPILFPIVNYGCSAAPTVPVLDENGDPVLDENGNPTFTGDPKPYNKCSQDVIDQLVFQSTTFATLNGQNLDLEIQRLESGPFTLTVPSNGQDPPSDYVPTVPPGSYKSAASGLWVYLPQGLEPGTNTLHWGGTFPNVDTDPSTDGVQPFKQDITYILTASS